MTTVSTTPSSVHVSSFSPTSCSDRGLVSPMSDSASSSNLLNMKNLIDSDKGKLINMKNLVQDEKLVVATLATLQSGGPSDIIKEELKYIIQSRRVAEGKEELKVDFSPPERNESLGSFQRPSPTATANEYEPVFFAQLTPEEHKKVEKRKEQNRLAARRFRQKRQEKNWTLISLTPMDVERREKRRERNRLAAQRSRERGKRKMDELMHEIEELQSKNTELEVMFEGLSKERDRLKRALLDHLSLCPSYEEPLNLSLKDT